jgi:hypothetical protein
MSDFFWGQESRPLLALAMCDELPSKRGTSAE